ncbi:MAG: flagellar basal body-associated FliL family protein [Candidatus Gastranaerophilales bacterium]|nr:flagellar basal body-associated FliL family protein [Candidatus Gastranaerophilales bacterium]
MKKNLLTVLILALQIVNIVLTSIMMISVMSTNNKTASLVGNIATAMNLELTVPGQGNVVGSVSLADTESYDLGNMTMLLQDGGYLVCNISLSINTKHEDYKTYGGENMDPNANMVKDAISTVVLKHTAEDCSTDMDGLKTEILRAVQQLFQSDFVYQIAISEVKIG